MIEREYRATYRGFTIISKKGQRSISVYVDGVKIFSKMTLSAVHKQIDMIYALTN